MFYRFKVHAVAAAFSFVAAPALACQPIVFPDVTGEFHEVLVTARDCAEVSNVIRGYANRARVTARGLSRVLAAQLGSYGDVSIVAVGRAQVGVYQRNGGEVDIDTYDGEHSVHADGGRVTLRNRGNNTIIVNATQ